jgi:N-acetylmuramoyl-L-alanine amidase
MRIAIDIGHLGKSNKPLDRGASYKGTNESDMALIYGLSAYGHLESAGHTVYLLTYGNYTVRHTFCKNNSIGLHMQCHVNAGQGNYSLIYCRTGNEGLELANEIALKFADVLPVSKAKVEEINSDRRGYGCIMSTIPSLLLEPLFLDNDEHYEELIEGDACFDIGKCISEGVLEWIKAKGEVN